MGNNVLVREAFVTLVSSIDYLKPAIVLQESLKAVNSKFPLVIAITKDLYTFDTLKILNRYGCLYEVINRLEYSDEVKLLAKDCPSVLNTASKIELFRLCDYTKFVYLDADCIVCENVDELFDYPDGSKIGWPGELMGQTCCMVFCPNSYRYIYYKILVQQVLAYDGNLLGNLWMQCKHPSFTIPITYGNEVHSRECKIFHFCN